MKNPLKLIQDKSHLTPNGWIAFFLFIPLFVIGMYMQGQVDGRDNFIRDIKNGKFSLNSIKEGL